MLGNLAGRSTEHSLMFAQQNTVQPYATVICDSVKAEIRIDLIKIVTDKEILFEVPDLFIYPRIFLTVYAEIRIGQNTRLVQAVID